MTLSEKEQQEINTLVGCFEADTGIQALAAVVGKADAYAEIPWKAYAVGSSIGALVVVVFPLLLADWSIASTLAFHAMAILGAGAALAAATTFVPSVARLFLDRVRAQVEARQYAMALFVEREVFRTSERRAVLVLVSRFERVAVIIADSGLAQYAPPADLERIAISMREVLVSQGASAAFERAFDALRALLARAAFVPREAAANELEDTVFRESDA
jgi:putative membrane protein